MDDTLHIVGSAQELLRCDQRILIQVEVQVAVADVTIGDQSSLGHVVGKPRGGLLYELRQGCDRHGDVMFETRAVQTLRARNVLAQEPEAVGLAATLGDGRVLDQAGGMRVGKDVLEDSIQRFVGAR